MIACSTRPDPNISEAKTTVGLILGHAYSVIKVLRVVIDGKIVELVRVRNPWGDEYEWNGAWSDNSVELNSLSDKTKMALDIVCKDDGEFFISKNDFFKVWYCIDTISTSP